MRRRYIALVLCLLAVAGAWVLWLHGKSQTAQRPAPPGGTGSAITAAAAVPLQTSPTMAAAAPKPALLKTNQFAYRLANTTNTIRQLESKPHALLLVNAFIDTDKPLDLKIPPQLQLKGNPGAYIVQARGLTDARFRNTLAAAGAEIVSYIPNNAYLVHMTPDDVAKLAGSPVVQAILPYEPYYKLQASLLGLAVNEQPLPPGTALNLGVFQADAAAAEAQIQQLGAKIIARDRSPFGPILRVLAPTDWTSLAQVPGVQVMEVSHTRTFANDLSRVTLGITPDTTSAITNDFLGLTGLNVLVAVNDSGVDATHPDFSATGTAQTGPSGPTRVIGVNPIDLVDTNGHGTHVAGIIAGNGSASLGINLTPPGINVGSNAQGSVLSADFRGKAPRANLISFRADNSDFALQTNAALAGVLISNNSWDYGNGDAAYDLAACSYDFATRDAVPGMTGSQPVLFVFAAGNNGGGDNSGQEGAGDTILSPGTAKNVVTVGALEQYRNITNIVHTVDNTGATNESVYWQAWTDSGDQVAWYSSRGNVGIGQEGNYGRFKPDVVAPGTFVVSTSDQFDGEWDTNAYYNPTNILESDYTYQLVDTNNWVYYQVAVPPNAVSVNIVIAPNKFSPSPFPNLFLYARQSNYPTTNTFDILTQNNAISIPPDSGGAITDIQAIQGSGFDFAVATTNSVAVNYNLYVFIQVTNDVGDLYQVLEGMNDSLGGYYRYETGTSMAAAAVSGELALIQDYFTNQFQPAIRPSPALMKAYLINGARSVANYGLAVTNSINFQGWGLPSIQNIIPTNAVINQFNQPGSSFFVEQNPTNALATGDSHTFLVNINTNVHANFLNLQATLVWTDPPGDPSAALKLVNNLDLIITNLDTGDVYFGNDIPPGVGFNHAWDTNSAPNLDLVNNVQNILLAARLSGHYSVTVVGRSVNVNAVTAQTNNATGQYAPNIVQDYALVLSVGEGERTNAFTVTDGGLTYNPTGDQNITIVTTTNTPLYNQIVGASSPLLGTNTLPLGTNTVWGPNGLVTIGMTNQWHFYVVTNNGPTADFTNAAFITFDALTLSIPRMGVYEDTIDNATRIEADIDLYVSQDSGLTNLSPVTISNCLAGNSGGLFQNDGGVSLGQEGTEFVYFTNSSPGQVYYIGVKAEDQMASEYAFLPVFTDIPFSQLDKNGNQIVHGLLLPQQIPDGNNAHPGVTNVFALAILPMVVEKVTVTNLNQHQNFGDLFGMLRFGDQHVVLNNHDGFGNTFSSSPIVYDDSRNKPMGTTNTDGPGTLRSFRGKSALGPWILGELDNAPTMTGQVAVLDLKIQPHRSLKQPGITVSVPAGGWFIDYVDVPAGYTNLTFFATNFPPVVSPAIQMYEKAGNEPTLTDYDQRADLTNTAPGTPAYPDPRSIPGNSISVGPPLPMGQYFIGLYNPGTVDATNVFLMATLGINSSVNDVYTFPTNNTTLLDDAVTNSTIFVGVTQQVASVNVGMVVNYPRVSDLTFTLVSPTGQRVLLMENRGAGSSNIGHLSYITNFFGTVANGDAGGATNTIPLTTTSGLLIVDYDFFGLPDNMDVYYDGVNIFHSGLVSFQGTFTIPYGPGVDTNLYIVMDGPGSGVDTNSLWTYTPRIVQEDINYLTFTDDTNLANVPIKFATLPLDLSDEGFTTNLSNFELATNGNYFAQTNLYDLSDTYDTTPYWTVPTNIVLISTIVNTNGQFVQVTNIVSLTNNMVSVVSDPRTAAGGSNYLALGLGTITRNVPFTIGRKYQVTYDYRGPGISGWWRGEGNASDSSDPEHNGNNGTLVGRFNFPAGVVGQAFQFEDPGNTFQFAATNTYVQIPPSATLNVGTNGGFTVEGWINPTNLSRPQPLVEWLAKVPTNASGTNVVIIQGPMLSPVTGHYYYLLAATNWITSEIWATNLGGYLATVETANEENWIYDTFTAYGTLNRDLWIGYTNSGAANAPFYWISGITNTTYTNWAPNQPLQCGVPAQLYTAIMGPTNAYPGLWKIEDNIGLTCGNPPTNPIYGVVEVTDIPTNGVQFWISGTNGTPASNSLQGCLYANIVDTNYVSHQIISAPGLLQSNVYQHVALTYSTNTGIAMLYLNGTNVATTNLGVFVPKTDGSVLLGWDMSHYTNNYYAGKMDEMSIYSRALSLAEISSIYQMSVPSTNGIGNTNGLIGKFDPTIFPPLALAKMQVSLGSNTNIMFADNSRWLLSGFTFTADTNSLPFVFTGLEPGVLLDSMTISEIPQGSLYYLPEQALAALNGESAFGNWQLQVWDNRAGAYITNLSGIVTWQLSFTLVSNAVVSASLPPQTPVNTTVASGQIVYYSVTVPQWAHFATNILVSSSLPVDLLFNQTNPPTGSQPNDYTLLSGSTGGIGLPILMTNGVPPAQLPLLTNQTYYLGVRNNGTHAAEVTLEVDYDIVDLTNGVPFTSDLNTNEYNIARYFQFDVSSNAYEATFQLLQLSSNADLVVRKGVPLPDLTSSDYASFNVSNLDETIYVLTNSAPVPLTAGRWYLGVMKRDAGDITYSVLAKELDLTNGVPNIFDLTNGVPFTWTAGPGAALTNFFRFRGTNFISNGVTNYMGVRFETYNQTGNGDLTLQTNAPPYASPFYQSSQNPGFQPELIIVQTNSALTNLAADWYLGVPNNETNTITFTILATIQTNLNFPAFPDAQGAGAGAIGGRFGTVYHVTTLADSGPGSLRAAVCTTNRTVIFDVSGTISLASPLVITNSYLTIAGQTACGGITVAGNVTTVQSAHDVIIRDVRFRSTSAFTNTGTMTAWYGGFETPGTPGTVTTVNAPNYFGGGWHVDSGNIDLINTTSQAYQGNDDVDMDGFGSTPGAISTNVTTVVGKSYTLKFAYSQNPSGPGNGTPTDAMSFSANGNVLGTVSVTSPNTSWDTLTWWTTSVVFTASSPTTKITFTSLTPGNFGNLLDAVSLSVVTNSVTYINTGESLKFLNSSNVIADHISAEWSSNSLVSVLNSSNITVQWSLMADGVNGTNATATSNSSVGSLLRYGGGTLSFHHNLYADNYSGSPRLGDNLTLDFVNNVVYNWGLFSGLSGGTNDFNFSTNGCTNQLNYVCNYLIAGPDTSRYGTNYAITNIAFFGGPTNANAANWFFQTNNFIDSDTNGILNGANTGWGMFTNQFTEFSRGFPTPPVSVDEAFIAYEKVLDFAGVALMQRDVVDTNIITKVRYQIGTLVTNVTATGVGNGSNSLSYLDTDQDGLPDFWEDTFTTNLVFIPSNTNDRNNDGYTDLEEYNNWLAVPHALTTVTNPVAVDLYKLCGNSGRLAFGVTNAINGTVYLTNVFGSYTNTTYFSNNVAIFTPTNSAGTNFSGYASFGFYVTNLDTMGYFGPVAVSVLVSAVPLATNPPATVIELTNGVPYTNSCAFGNGNTGGSVFYHIAIPTNRSAALFELDNPSGPMAMVVRKGLPLPSLSSYDYFTNAPAFPANQEIAVLTNSVPVPLTNGDWYMAAVNLLGAGNCESYSVKVTTLGSILPPVFLFPTNAMTTNIVETVSNAINCVATDPNTPPLPLSFALVTGPTGLTVSNGVIYWTPTEAQGPSTNSVAVSVSNGAFTITNTFTIVVQESNLPPAFVLTNPPNQVVIMPPGAFAFTNAATDPDIPVNPLTYTLFTTVPGANVPAIDTNGVITWTATANDLGSNYLFMTVVTDTNPPAINQKSFSVTNFFTVFVVPPLPPGTPNTNVLQPGQIRWFAIIVPTNAIYATNTLIFATLPVNLWFTTNTSLTITNANDRELLANALSGVSVLSTNRATAPTNIVQGGVYYLGVQNTNSVAVTNAVRVDFAYAPAGPTLPAIPTQVIGGGDTLVVSNTATDNDAGAVLVYRLTNSPAGAVISSGGVITWPTTPNIAPTNVVITTIVTDTHLNLSATNSFTVIVLPVLITDQPQTNIVAANSINWFKVNVPWNALQATNSLLFATAQVNLWFTTNAPPSITNAADAELLKNVTSGISVLSTNLATAPTNIVPGWRYYLGVQNTNSFAVTNAVEVTFNLVIPHVSIFSIVQTNMGGSNGFLVTWYAPTNYQFHLQWTPSLLPASWANFNGVISFTSYIAATNSQFQYFDDGSQTGGFGPTRFYRLLLLDSPTNTAPFFLFTPGTLNAAPQVPFVFTNRAKDWDIPAQALTYTVTNTLIGTNLVTIDPHTGGIAWTPTSAQLGLTNLITTTVTDNGVPAKSAVNVFAVIVSTNTAAAPAFSSISLVAGGLQFQWTAPSSDKFQIRWTTNLAPAVWTTFPNIITSPTTNFSFVDTNQPLLWMKFYQLILLP